MKNFVTDIKQLYHSDRISLVVIILNVIASIALFVFSIIKLSPDSAIVKVGYGDIGGYRNGSWADMLAFPLLAIIFGIFHNLIALRIFEKRGASMAKFFVLITLILVAGTFVLLLRLTGEI